MYVLRHRLACMLLFLPLLSVSLWGCQGTGQQQNHATPSPSLPPGQSGGWNSFLLAFPVQSSLGQREAVLNGDNTNAKSEMLTQAPLMNPQFDGIAPDGRDLLYQWVNHGQTRYTALLTAGPGPGFFYTQPGSGNAIWLTDSRHALVLDQRKGVVKVDVQTGQAQQILSNPFTPTGQTGPSQVTIGQLVFVADGFLYFIGAGGGACMGALCRVPLGASHPPVTQLSGRQMTTTYWLSPDRTTIYYWQTGPVGVPGIHALRVDGTHAVIVRPGNGLDDGSGIPIGFARDGSLIIMRAVSGTFQVVQVGATPPQDRILLADAAPGARSLCPPSVQGNSAPLCDQNSILAPDAHAIVVQSTSATGAQQLWSTDLITGKQQLLHMQSLPSNTPVHLLGWDLLPVCAGNRC
jgi:hypothetical protein